MRFVFSFVCNSAADAEKFGEMIFSDESKGLGIKAGNQIKAVYQVEIRHNDMDQFLDFVETIPVENELLSVQQEMIHFDH